MPLPRLRVVAVLLAAGLVGGFATWRVERQVGQARLALELTDAAASGQHLERLAQEAPDLLGLAARQAAGEGRWQDVRALGERHAGHLPPALLAAAALELGLDPGGGFSTIASVEEDGARAALEAGETATEAEAPPLSSAFERRLRRAQQVDAAGIAQLLLDRRGRSLGFLSVDGVLELDDGLPSGLVPPELASRLQPSAQEAPGLAAAGPGAMPAAGPRALRLTIDRTWSEAALAALGREEGAITVMEIPTGGVMAAVANRRRRSPWRSRGDSVFDPREPASIAKLITTTAAMRAGVNPDESIADSVCRGSVLMDGERLYCSAVRGRLRGLTHAMASSCNVSFARLAMEIGDRALVEEYERYGFVVGGLDGASANADPIGVVHEYRHAGTRLGDLSIGLDEASITPLGGAVFAATLADGLRRRPTFVLQEDGLLGISPRPPASVGPGPVQVLDPEWLPLLHDSMRAVVRPGGTANRVAPPRLRVAMKTGTARDPDKPFHVNYIGFFPSDDVRPPRYAFAVRVTAQPTSSRVRRAAYGVTRRLLRALDGLAGAEIEASAWSAAPVPGAIGP